MNQNAIRDVVEVRNVSHFFDNPESGSIPVLSKLSLRIRQQEFVSIVGPSGAGKSTLFNIISGLLTPSEGSVLVHGQDIRQSTGHVGYMMQKDLLFPWRTVIENVGLGLEIKGAAKSKRKELGRDYLRRYGLESFADAYPSTLSGGMRQRVAFIRTLVTNPDIILLDEPFSALDYQTRLVLEEEILSVLREQGKTVVLVTHDIGEAIAMSDRVVVMSKRPGTVKQIYDVGLAALHGSALRARADHRYNDFFEAIWKDLDIQIGREA
jgi:NitT/TauT family transport system ATP-binding protein